MPVTGQHCHQTAFLAQHVCNQFGILYILVNLIISHTLITIMSQFGNLAQAGIGKI